MKSAVFASGKICFLLSTIFVAKVTFTSQNSLLSLLDSTNNNQAPSSVATSPVTSTASSPVTPPSSLLSLISAKNVSKPTKKKNVAPSGNLEALLQKVLAKTNDPEYQAAMAILNDQSLFQAYQQDMMTIELNFFNEQSKKLQQYAALHKQGKQQSLTALISSSSPTSSDQSTTQTTTLAPLTNLLTSTSSVATSSVVTSPVSPLTSLLPQQQPSASQALSTSPASSPVSSLSSLLPQQQSNGSSASLATPASKSQSNSLLSLLSPGQ
jgi:hypothetical protein